MGRDEIKKAGLLACKFSYAIVGGGGR